MDDKHPVAHMIMVILAWVGSVQLGQVQTFIAILSGLLVALYTAMRIFYLIRDKKDNG